MAHREKAYANLLSVPRFTTLLGSLIVSLSSGTNYVYSAYAPQLGSHLHITHTQVNVIGLAANVGMQITGPFWGRIVDHRGPRILLVSAFVLLLAGYAGIRYIFDSGLPTTSSTISTPTFCALVLCGFMTGAGGIAGLNSALNSTAKTFPDKARATATGVVLSGFGLSAFFFSSIARAKFADNTSSLLLLLSLGTSLPMIFGFFFVRQIPLPSLVTQEEERHSYDEFVPMLEQDGEMYSLLAVPAAGTSTHLSRREALKQGRPPNVYGSKLFRSSDFWLLATILSLLAGTGVTFINNVGSMSRALYIKSVDAYNPIDAARWQADQVTSISLLNFAGRIFIGLVSDYTKNRFEFPRSYSLVLASILFFISQVMAAFVVDDIRHLWMASAMLGLAYGSTFPVLLNVCLEWFGMPHFSENLGYLSLSPIVAVNVFSVVFGRTLDAHDTSSSNLGISSKFHTTGVFMASDAENMCALGRRCYVDALYLTIGACFVSIILSIWAGWRDRVSVTRSGEEIAEI